MNWLRLLFEIDAFNKKLFSFDEVFTHGIHYSMKALIKHDFQSDYVDILLSLTLNLAYWYATCLIESLKIAIEDRKTSYN